MDEQLIRKQGSDTTPEEDEFLRQVDEFRKVNNNRKFVSPTDCLFILKRMGYRKGE